MSFLLGLGLGIVIAVAVYAYWSSFGLAARNSLICCIMNAQFENLGQVEFEKQFGSSDPAAWQEAHPDIAKDCKSNDQCVQI